MYKKDVLCCCTPSWGAAPPCSLSCVLGLLGVLPFRLGAASPFSFGVFSCFLSLFLSLVLLLSLVLRWLFLPFVGVLRSRLCSLWLLAVLPSCVVSVVLLVFLGVRCGVRWLRLVTLVRLWSLASLALGLLPLPRVRLVLVRSGLMLFRLGTVLTLALFAMLLRLLPLWWFLVLLTLFLLLFAWLLRGVCLCLPNCFSSLLLLGWACFFFQPPTKETAMFTLIMATLISYLPNDLLLYWAYRQPPNTTSGLLYEAALIIAKRENLFPNS